MIILTLERKTCLLEQMQKHRIYEVKVTAFQSRLLNLLEEKSLSTI